MYENVFDLKIVDFVTFITLKVPKLQNTKFIGGIRFQNYPVGTLHQITDRPKDKKCLNKIVFTSTFKHNFCGSTGTFPQSNRIPKLSYLQSSIQVLSWKSFISVSPLNLLVQSLQKSYQS